MISGVILKKVMLILEGIVAKKFLNTILEKYFSNNLYIVITNEPNLIPAKIPSSFSFFCFDPTSRFRLESVSNEVGDVSDIFIIMENTHEKKAVFEIMRELYKDARVITFLDGFEDYDAKKDEKNVFIDRNDLVAGQFISRLPNVPIIPNGFGLGLGEIMEIGVPFGSVFAYRHIGSIQQKKYKIIGVYRQNELILATFSLIIQPQDIILVAGDPKALTSVYNQVKANIGQFPAPFGRDIYLYVDMLLQSDEVIIHNIKEAIFVHSHIKSTKLIINVLHPTNFQTIYHIQELCGADMSINLIFEYHEMDFREKLKKDSEKKIGLVIVGNEIFKSRKNRKALFAIDSPVLKIAKRSLESVKTSFVVLNSQMNEGENISSVIFDISIQIKLNVCVYDFEPDGHHQNNIIKDYETMGRNLDKKITLIKTSIKNPIFYLQESKEAVLQFLPFEECITQFKIYSLISTRSESLSILLNDHPQIFIPIIE